MKKIDNKKIFSGLAVLAITATAALGTISLAGLGREKFNYNPVSDAENNSANTFSTALGAAPRSTGDIHYIDVNGTTVDEGADGTEAKPYNIREIGNADLFKPGDIILINPGVYELGKVQTETGVYEEYISLNYSGTFDKYITIMNASAYNNGNYQIPTEEVVLDFSQQKFLSTNRGVHIYGSFFYWYGIDVCGAGDNGLYISGSYNTVEYSEFYNNRDTGLQLGRAYSEQASINDWPSYNLIKNCTSHNNYDNQTAGENADGFAAKLTVGYGNVFDGCIAYRNSDDGWDLYAKTDSGNIGAVIIYNCVAFENGFLEYTQEECNARFPDFDTNFAEANTNSYKTSAGDGNGFKLGGSVMEGDVVLYNCLSFNNRMHGVTDNSNPGTLSITGVTSYDNSAGIDNNPASPNFGQVISVTDEEGCNNIDVSRQTFSYNNLNAVLSLKSGINPGLGDDLYRASVRNSIFGTATNSKDNSHTKAYKVTTPIDADSKNGIKGAEINALSASEILEQVPIVKDGNNYTYNMSVIGDLGSYDELQYDIVYDEEDPTLVVSKTLLNHPKLNLENINADRIHKQYRNSDGSVNMKGMLEVKDYTKLLGEDNKIGSRLSEANWGAYTHFYADDYVDGGAADDTAARLARITEALTLNCDPEAVYQDFEVPTLMTNATIEWSWDQEGILTLEKDVEVSVSGSMYATIVVHRDLEEDKQVTLKATVTYNGQTAEKTFNLTIKKDEPRIGTVYAVTSSGEKITNGSVIVDAYALYTEPEIVVENGADYNGKLLDKSQYEVKSTYYYAPDKNTKSFEIKGFTASTPGVYTVTKTVNIKGDTAKTTFSYYIYVASPAANVDFVQNKVTVTVNRDGYIIEGDLSNVTGSLYALSSPTKLSLNASSIKTQAGVKSQAFRSDSVRMQLENDNSGEYYVYYALANVNGDVTSKVYETKINVVNVSDIATFTKVAKGTAVDGEKPAETIYMLTTDLDFKDNGTFAASGTFSGLFNGNGHTLKNLKTSQSVFNKVKGGTIMNLKIENFTIDATAEKAGFIGVIHGGFVHNVQMTNVKAYSSAARLGALIGQAEEGFTYISQISVVNTDPNLSIAIAANKNRVAGILGYIQSQSSPDGELHIEISDCYVDAKFAGGSEVGGIVGAYNGGYAGLVPFSLNINHCVFAGEVWAYTTTSLRVAGILGYHSNASSSKLVISNCLSIGKSYMDSVDSKTEIKNAVKNASAIVGGFDAAADAQVYDCIGLLDEYNANFRVEQYEMKVIAHPDTFGEYVLNFDTDKKWTLTLTDNGDGTYSYEHGFIKLNYLG